MNKSLSVILALLLLLLACEKSKVDILQERLDVFRSILPDSIRQEFDSKNYENVVIGIDSLLQYDSSFKEKYRKLKHEEAIDVFSTQEVVDFFRIYFVDEVEKLKGKKEKRW